MSYCVTNQTHYRQRLEASQFESETNRMVLRRAADLTKNLSKVTDYQSGVESSLDENDVKSYIEEITEIKRRGHLISCTYVGQEWIHSHLINPIWNQFY
jgi:hypothetical protein